MQYVARKDNTMFYVTPDMLEYYAEQGYAITKLVEEEIEDLAAEAEQAMESLTVSDSYQAPEPEARPINE